MQEEEREDEHSKTEITVPEKYVEQENFIEEAQMQFNIGFCLLAVLLKIMPVILYFFGLDLVFSR